MKTLTEHINEALKIGKNLSEWSAYSCQPKTKDELQEIIKDRIDKEGPKCDLNDIDVSLIEDMTGLFWESIFNGDISKWDVSNVTNMARMFYDCELFNKDISSWDVSNVTNMKYMFYKCESFNQDISNWDVSNVTIQYGIFYNCPIKNEYKPKFK